MQHEKQQFIDTVWDYYTRHGRHELPWRLDTSSPHYPYHVFVSEMMLQQTQVSRVIEKYNQWIQTFPTVESVAKAPFSQCLGLWMGLGYNRRVRFLHQACQQIMTDYGGIIPANVEALCSLPGIGINTASAIIVYAFNKPAVFVETNIRTVYIHHFFVDKVQITDKEILAVVSQTLDSEHSRDWFWALMDYGSYLKRTTVRRNEQSAHYSKQSKFDGSRRQLRGIILRRIHEKALSLKNIENEIKDDRVREVVYALEHEGLLVETGVKYTIPT